MSRLCSICGAELSFRGQFVLNGQPVCRGCLDRHEESKGPSANNAILQGMQLASVEARLGGQLVDGLVWVMLILLGALMSTVFDSGLIYGLFFLAGLSYYLVADGLPGGRSLGKHIAGTAVVDAVTGRPCTVAQSIGRNLLGLLGVFDWIFIFGSRRERLGDKAAGTIVIKKD